MFAKGHIRGYPLFKKWTLDIILTRGIPWEKGQDGIAISIRAKESRPSKYSASKMGLTLMSYIPTHM